ncbi:hypothetical protein [Embleya sp. NPDC059237]|uniref:hypothetical protein n=1 Tax=Embleya sp. NPDC059237 TaxID=3346784 RepID=UPI0036A400B3
MKALGAIVELTPFLVVAFGFTYLIRAILNADRRERALLDARDRAAAPTTSATAPAPMPIPAPAPAPAPASAQPANPPEAREHASDDPAKP